MIDFPAAHSMDTTWFAIDADGCIGIFDSDEGGAVPENEFCFINSNSIYNGVELLDIFTEKDGQILDRHLTIDSLIQDMKLDNLRVQIDLLENFNLKYDRHDPNMPWGLLLVVSTPETIQEIRTQAQQRFLIIRELYYDNDKIVIYLTNCQVSWLKDAIESGKVIGGKEVIKNWCKSLDLLGSHYTYICDSGDPAPYTANELPSKPILFQDLPLEISDRLKAVKFHNLRFAEHKSIQPIEHMPCRTWNTDNWLGTDGEWHEGFPDYADDRNSV
jgi:hypothetical protein